jgi:choline monooxygenase
MYDHSRIESGSVGPHFAFYEPLAPNYLDGVERHSPLPLIDHVPREQLGAYVPMLFPKLGLSATESAWSTFHVIPLAPDRSAVEIRSKVMPVSGWEFAKQAWRSTWSFPWKSGGKSGASAADDPLASGDFMTEDIYVCEQQQRGMASPRFSVGGSAKNLECGIRNFHTEIQRRSVDR